jgi:hypothetical protein
MEAGLFEIAAGVRLALSAGVPPAQAFREWRGYGITALAMASGVPAAVIAEHEAGRRELTREECDAIGLALGVPCELLLDPGAASSRRSIVQGEHRTGI